jgi:hypothetical protein
MGRNDILLWKGKKVMKYLHRLEDNATDIRTLVF